MAAKYLINETSIDLFQVAAFEVVEDTLVVYTTGGTLYFNAPDDIEDTAAALVALNAAFDARS